MPPGDATKGRYVSLIYDNNPGQVLAPPSEPILSLEGTKSNQRYNFRGLIKLLSGDLLELEKKKFGLICDV